MTPTDRIRTRTVLNQISLVEEHLEAMQRDVHGLEYGPWKREVDGLWKRIFEQIGRMSAGPQRSSLETIRELWTMYVKHHAAVAR